MKQTFISSWLLATCLLLSTHVVLADKVFVRDTLYVPLRGGQSTEHHILHKGIRSGTQLERLEINKETGYSRVRTDRGLEGWILSQYLVKTPIAADRLDATQAKLDAVQKNYDHALTQLDEQKAAITATKEQLSTLSEDNLTTTEELERITQLASDVITINDRNEQLKAEREGLNQEIDALYARNSELASTSNQAWFLRGAGTILLGLLFGFWVARKIYISQKSSWS